MDINKIYNEDCVKTMERMPSEFIDAVITSPPYDDLRNYKGFRLDFPKIAKGLFRILKDGGVVVWVVGDATIDGSETGTSFRQALFFKKVGLRLHDTMIYQKENPVPISGYKHFRYEPSFEYMFVLSKYQPKTFNPIQVVCRVAGSVRAKSKRKSKGEKGYSMKRCTPGITNDFKSHSNIFTYSVGTDKNKTNHPAPFPIRLVKDQMKTWTNKGDLVYDPFMGSGTVARVAIQGGRHYIGSEISKEYYKEANERIKKTSKGFFQEL